MLVAVRAGGRDLWQARGVSAPQPPSPDPTEPADALTVPDTPVTRTAARDAALVAELAKKTAVSWVRHAGRSHPVWHVWSDGALCVVSGGTEQRLADIGDGEPVEVVMRSKDDGGRLVTWVGTASVVRPGQEEWEPTTTALVAARLNLPDISTATERWARTSVVRRVVPTGEFLEAPGDLSDDAHLAVPVETPATTRGPLPRILHRRVRRRPRLS